MSNRNTIQAACEAARKWFDNPDLITTPEKIQHHFPTAMVHIGDLVSIEYASDKFDGKDRVYRHDSEQPRSLYISPDGCTIVIKPGFRVTKAGLEG